VTRTVSTGYSRESTPDPSTNKNQETPNDQITLTFDEKLKDPENNQGGLAESGLSKKS